MAKKWAAASLRALSSSSAALPGSRDPLMQCLAPVLSRSMATEAAFPSSSSAESRSNIISSPIDTTLTRRSTPTVPDVLTTIYSFPDMEPLSFKHYKASQLQVPLRRDILHRAIIFEGDATRQGTASTKGRSEIHGSGRKIRPQKGMGKARLGDKKSPMLRGGGVVFGPKPRDFATKLPRKIYDLAWRTALSYRYKRGQLIVIEAGELDTPESRWLQQIMERNHLGLEDGRSTIITAGFRPNLFTAFEGIPKHGEAREVEDVDVKNLLDTGRIIIEREALDRILMEHS